MTRWSQEQLENYQASRTGKTVNKHPVKQNKYRNKPCIFFTDTGRIVYIEDLTARLETKEQKKKYIAGLLQYKDKNIFFHSYKEANRYIELLTLKDFKKISNLRRQPKYVLLDKYTTNQGEKIKEIIYVGDFEYYDEVDKKLVCEDVKGGSKGRGTQTKDFLLKKKMFEDRYRDIILRLT